MPPSFARDDFNSPITQDRDISNDEMAHDGTLIYDGMECVPGVGARRPFATQSE